MGLLENGIYTGFTTDRGQVIAENNAVAWALMVDEAKKDPNIHINAFSLMGSMSGYRTFEQQYELFEANNRALWRAERHVTSNHGWGLAIDFNVTVYGQKQKRAATMRCC